jgi:DNA repair exonuclease SbcCD ATPase subunit
MSDGITEAYKNVQTLTHDHKQETPYTKQIWAYLEKVEADNAVLREQLERKDERIKTLEALDSEAAEFVETPICMRTPFTGEEPYVGWKGIGLALTEALDERDALRLKVQELTKFYDKHVGTPCEQIRHQQEVETLNERLDAYRKDLTTLETLVRALPKVEGEISALHPYVVQAIRANGDEELVICATHPIRDALAALLTHRQGMEG